MLKLHNYKIYNFYKRLWPYFIKTQPEKWGILLVLYRKWSKLLKGNHYTLFCEQYLAMAYEETNQQLMRLTNHSIMLLIKTNQQLMRLTNHSMMLLIKTNSLWTLKNTLESIFNDAMNRDSLQFEFDSGKCHHSFYDQWGDKSYCTSLHYYIKEVLKQYLKFV